MRSVHHVLVGLASFLAVAALQTSLIPRPSDYGMRAKAEYHAEHAGEYDVLFVGSSITLHGIVPEVFDAVLAERGHPLKSFNLGVAAMVSLEGDHLLREALSHSTERLQYVFLEAENWSPIVWDGRNSFTARTVHWHDLLHTRYAIGAVSNMGPVNPKTGRSDGPDAYWKWDETWTHLRLFAYRSTSGGQGRRMISALPGIEPDPSLYEFVDVATLDRLRGYIDPAELPEGHPELPRWQKRREDFAAKMDQYIGIAKGLDAANAAPRGAEHHFQLEGLLEQIEAVRAAGAEPIYYTGPRAAATPVMYGLAKEGILPTYFGFNRPRQYEVLYRPDRHIDNNHLNRMGAEEWTRIFAGEFADFLDRRGD